ncbi:acid-resistance protein [Enterobacterales bacterium 8AC]|jgi:acid stress chaperone HdeB|nr:acid-resistance protein [Enterobacterales bacterium 8AC]
MFIKSLKKIALNGLLFSVAIFSLAVKAETITTPSDMTCKEFLDLNPKSMTPVVYWVMNDDTRYKGGDYVDLHETGSVVTPKVVEACHQTPDRKFSDMKDDILAFAKK